MNQFVTNPKQKGLVMPKTKLNKYKKIKNTWARPIENNEYHYLNASINNGLFLIVLFAKTIINDVTSYVLQPKSSYLNYFVWLSIPWPAAYKVGFSSQHFYEKNKKQTLKKKSPLNLF